MVRKLVVERPILRALGGALLGAAPAVAQGVPPPVGPAVSASDPAAAPAATADTGAIGDIIVTARRRNESIQQTPIAMTAITPANLEAKATLTIADLQGAAPNLLITQQNSGAAATNLSIRGLAFADIEKSFEPTVGVVVDGVFIGTSTGQLLDFFDIASIEVLRGPQGTLFGRNTIGGVINIRRSRPTGSFGGKVEASYASHETWATRGILNIPVVDGLLSAKAFYFRTESEGYYFNSIRNRFTGGGVNQNFGASFLLTPSDNFDALLTLEKQVQDSDVVNSNIAQTGEVFCLFEPARECNRNTRGDLYEVFNSPAAGHYSSPAVTLEINWNTGPIKLTSITSYRESDEAQTQDFDASSADLYYTNRVQSYHQVSQEFRGAGKIYDRLDYVAGLYYFDSEYKLNQATRLFGADLPAPQIASGTNQSFAGFADFNWEFIDRVRLSFGGRYTFDKKSFSNQFGPVLGTPSASFEKFTPKLGIDYRPNNDYLLYASWSRGYRSGGFSNRAQTVISTNTAFGPETVDSYEIGVKSAFFDRKLLFNVAAFYAEYSQLQQNTTIAGGPTGNETIVSNVGSSKVKGVEIDFTARPVRALTISGGVGFLDNSFSGFITGGSDPITGGRATFDYSKVDSIYSPDLTASINGTYTVPLGFGEGVLNIGYRYISPYDQQISIGPFTRTVAASGAINVVVDANDPRVRTDRQGLLDASATLRFDIGSKQARLTVFGRNIADDRGPQAAFTVAGLWSFASAREPRTAGVQLGFDF